MRCTVCFVIIGIATIANALEDIGKEADTMNAKNNARHVTTSAQQPPRLHLAEILSYLTMHIRSQHGPVPVTGTGFFFTFRIKDGRGMFVPALVTNRHVVLGFSGTTLLFTVAKDGLPTDETVEFKLGQGNNVWYVHPDPDVDLCALPLLPIINHFKKQGIELFMSSLNHTFVADNEFLRHVTQLDEVAMIGYPDGIWDKVNNQPIFRKGVFATKPGLNYNGKREFIIDMPVYGGSSGSPVLIASDGPWVDRSHGHSLLTHAPTKLMGVVYKTFIHNDLGKLVAVPIPTVSNDRANAAIVKVPNNLGLVISASRLLEMEDEFTRMWGVKSARK